MPGATFCPKCGKRWRSDRHVCAPSAIKHHERRKEKLEAIESSSN